MDELFVAAAAIVVGLVGLVWGADRFVAGSASVAKALGISPLVIGLTIVSIGTSAPEIIVAINASLQDAGDMAVGNALGSNLANIGLVLGITALVSPLPTQRHLLKEEAPILLVITALAGVVLFNGELSRPEGFLLLALLVPTLVLAVWYKKRHPAPEQLEEAESLPQMSIGAAAIWFCLGLAVMLVSSEALVWGAKQVAFNFGVSQLVVGLTVVAVGTSLPELAASVMSALRGHHDIAIGNIFGSNLFNLLAVMSMPGIISPVQLGDAVFARDFLIMAGMTLLLVGGIAWAQLRAGRNGGKPLFSRYSGILLLGCYSLYYVFLAQSL